MATTTTTSVSVDQRQRKLGVFWDIENIQVPRGLKPSDVVDSIRAKVYPSFAEEVVFEAYLDVTRFSEPFILELQRAFVKLVHVSGHNKNSADIHIMQAINDFVKSHGLCMVILISSDENFLPVARSLKRNPDVISYIVHSRQVSDALVQAFDRNFEWPHLECSTPSVGMTSNSTWNTTSTSAGSSSSGSSTAVALVSKKRNRLDEVEHKVDTGPVESSMPHQHIPQEKPISRSAKRAKTTRMKRIRWACLRCQKVFISQHYAELHRKRNYCSKPQPKVQSSTAVTPEKLWRPRSHPIIRCDQCGFKFLSFLSLVRHCEKLNHQMVFGCGICTMHFPSQEALTAHQTVTGHLQQFQCGMCQSYFRSERALRYHWHDCQHANYFTCGGCEREFPSYEVLVLHLQATGHQYLFKCSKCDRPFATKKAVSDHQRERLQCSIQLVATV